MKPLVSILIPAYNAENWIPATIRSALAQTWERKEIIVVDDGSRDRTLDVARHWESEHVKVVTQPNSGACAARNKCLSLAQGDYIQWLDADDLLAPDKIALQMKRREQESDPLALFTSAWGRFYHLPERTTFRQDSLWRDMSAVDWIITKFQDGVWMNPAAWLVSRQLTELAGSWDSRLASSGDDDGEYLCRIVARSTRVSFVGSSKAFYRIGNAGSLSWRQSAKALDGFYLATCLCLDHLRTLEDSERTRAASITFLQKRLRYFLPMTSARAQALESLARELGGTLVPPTPSGQFRMVSSLVGWDRAMALKQWLWRSEVFCLKSWDRFMCEASRLRSASR